MRIIRILFLITLILPLSIVAQKSNRQNVRLKKDKPSIYISFERYEILTRDNEEKRFVFFRLHNNNRWNIWLQMSSGFSEKYNDVGLYYDIKTEAGQLVESHRCHVCSINPLRPGKSLLFAIPLDLLNEDKGIEIMFDYEWQRDAIKASLQEPVNIVSFWGANLPKQK